MESRALSVAKGHHNRQITYIVSRNDLNNSSLVAVAELSLRLSAHGYRKDAAEWGTSIQGQSLYGALCEANKGLHPLRRCAAIPVYFAIGTNCRRKQHQSQSFEYVPMTVYRFR